MHNLKNVDVAIKRNSFTVVSGLSGSGKSSLAFDTLYAEGAKRRYIEKPIGLRKAVSWVRSKSRRLTYIKGISPAIAIEQKVNTQKPEINGWNHHRDLRLREAIICSSREDILSLSLASW